MPMIEQPPPGPDILPDEGPPPGWNGMTRQKVWGLVAVFVVMLVIVVACLPPMVLRSTKASERTMATSNAKQLALALIEFDQEFGKFPHESTVPLVQSATGTGLSLAGHSSNAMLRQLIAYGIESEDIFDSCHPEMPTSGPDNDIRPGQALKPGEVGFSYVAGLDSSMNPGLPVLAANMMPGTEEFWDRPFGGKAVILRIDTSVDQLMIRASDSKVTVGGGLTLFDPSAPYWPKGHTIDLRHPER